MVAVQRLGQLLRQHEALLSGAAFAVRGMYGVPLCIQPLGAPADLVGQQGLLHKRGLRWMQVRWGVWNCSI